MSVGMWRFRVPIPYALSSYYHTPLALLFAGFMVAIGLGLVAYKGYPEARHEDWISSLAGVAAICVGMFPPREHSDDSFSLLNGIHAVSAVVTMALMCYFTCQFQQGSERVGKKQTRNRVYKVCLWIMVRGLLASIVLSWQREHAERWVACAVTISEVLTILPFAFAWLVKGGGWPWLNDTRPTAPPTARHRRDALPR